MAKSNPIIHHQFNQKIIHKWRLSNWDSLGDNRLQVWTVAYVCLQVLLSRPSANRRCNITAVKQTLAAIRCTKQHCCNDAAASRPCVLAHKSLLPTTRLCNAAAANVALACHPALLNDLSQEERNSAGNEAKILLYKPNTKLLKITRVLPLNRSIVLCSITSYPYWMQSWLFNKLKIFFNTSLSALNFKIQTLLMNKYSCLSLFTAQQNILIPQDNSTVEL